MGVRADHEAAGPPGFLAETTTTSPSGFTERATIGFPNPTAPRRPQLPAFATVPVLLLLLAVGALLAWVSNHYGYVSDELYFLAAGKYYLTWGYMDQQPLVPILAWLLDAIFPGQLWAFRLPALLVTLGGILVTALLAREFGADRRAQVLAAAAYPLAPWLLLSGHWLAAATLEPLQWLSITWLLARWTRLWLAGWQADWLLLVVGLIATSALQTKFQIVVFATALLLGVLLAGPWTLLARWQLWLGVGFTLVTAIPTLVWQAVNDWPALDMGTVINRESSRLLFVPSVLLFAGLGVGAVLCCYGLWCLARLQEFQPYRFLTWAVVLSAVFFLLAGGRGNYLAGLYGLLFTAAALGLQKRRESGAGWARMLGVAGSWQRWLPWPAYLLSAVIPVALLPIYPLDWLARHPEVPSFNRLYETDWPALAQTTARVYFSLPPEQRQRTAIVGESYYVTGALDVHGRDLGLPRAYSPHRGYWFFGAPPDEATTMLYVGSVQPLAPHFGPGQQLATVPSYRNMENIAGGIAVTLYENPRQPWSSLWPRIRTM